MSDNEYLLIKHNKKNKDIKKNIFYDETGEKEDNESNSINIDESKSKENESDNNEEEKTETNKENGEDKSVASNNTLNVINFPI